MKAVRAIYTAISYIMFFLLVYSLVLNAVALIVPVFTGESFTVDYWELIFIPFIIVIEAVYFRPVYPKFLETKR